MKMDWSSEIWRGLVESSPDALVVIDGSGTILYVSAQAEKLFGYSNAELLKQKIEFLIPSRYREQHVIQRQNYFYKPKIRPMGAGLELFGLNKDGREIPIEISLSPLQTPQGMLVTASVRDISDRKKVQMELQRARDTAESANRTKSEFLANMTHEIRTPIAGILGYTEMICLADRTEEQRKSYMEKVRRCAETLATLINDILDVSKVEAGALTLEILPIDLVAETEGVIGLLQSRAFQKDVRLDVQYERPLPERIATDPTRIRQILSNLIGNAIKFTDVGKISVRVSQTEKDPKEICFTVSDTGCGIAEQHKGKLFQPFVQADSSTTRKYGGTGLGLALSARLAKALGGEITLQSSELGKGSVFVFKIPATVFRRTPHSVSTTFYKALPRLDDLRILLADDNLDNQELIKTFLAEQGAEVDLASDGEEALLKATSKSYSILLMDIQMPKMDGFDVIAKLREEGHRVPIVALTAHAMNQEKMKAQILGCDAFLTKPFERAELIQIVSNLTTQPPR